MSLVWKVKKLEAQLEIAKRGLWHYSKYLSWGSIKDYSRVIFNIYENRQFGHITEADEIAKEALKQIHAIDNLPMNIIAGHKEVLAIKKWAAG